jgi:hypothetical protein
VGRGGAVSFPFGLFRIWNELGPRRLIARCRFYCPIGTTCAASAFPRAEAAPYPTSARPGADGHLAEPSECAPVQLGMFGWPRSSHFDSAWSGSAGQFRERANGQVTAFLDVELCRHVRAVQRTRPLLNVTSLRARDGVNGGYMPGVVLCSQ